jgi:hypothetical protein
MPTVMGRLKAELLSLLRELLFRLILLSVSRFSFPPQAVMSLSSVSLRRADPFPPGEAAPPGRRPGPLPLRRRCGPDDAAPQPRHRCASLTGNFDQYFDHGTLRFYHGT